MNPKNQQIVGTVLALVAAFLIMDACVYTQFDIQQRNAEASNLEPYYCLVHDVYGQFGNNALTLLQARLYAKRSGLKLAILPQRSYSVMGSVVNFVKLMYIKRLMDSFELQDVYWNVTHGSVRCEVSMTWEQMFFKKDEVRAQYLDELEGIPLAKHYRDKAESEMRRYGAGFSVHGRSYENQCIFSTKHDHTPVPCRGFTHNLCADYTYATVVRLFQLTGLPVLFTDRQSPPNEYTYYAHGGILDTNELMVQLWMMVLSPHHVGSLGSSLDFLVWLWKRDHANRTLMHPAECYPLGPT